MICHHGVSLFGLIVSLLGCAMVLLRRGTRERDEAEKGLRDAEEINARMIPCRLALLHYPSAMNDAISLKGLRWMSGTSAFAAG